MATTVRKVPRELEKDLGHAEGLPMLRYQKLKDLTLPEGKTPYLEFESQFSLGEASTESTCQVTNQLSFQCQKDLAAGLRALSSVDTVVSKGLLEFEKTIKAKAKDFSQRLNEGGRLFIVGSGSSGRIGVDLAAKCRAAFPCAKGIHGIIAGGDAAMIRAKEGFEDSAASGEKAMADLKLTKNDTVILVSASGSASFNVGAGNEAANCEADVFYFYNSEKVPARTVQLFERQNHPVVPWLVDIGPQAISGSTRLQAASLAIACLGALLTCTLLECEHKSREVDDYVKRLAKSLEASQIQIQERIDQLAKFVRLEKEVFSHQNANFGKAKDPYNQGYVTFIAAGDSIREVLIDTTETSPTFATCPLRRESEGAKKKAEFKAFVVGADSNAAAWKQLLGKDEIEEDATSFLIDADGDGLCSYASRPPAKGNCVFAVVKLESDRSIDPKILDRLKVAKAAGASTGLIVTCREKFVKGLDRDDLEKFGAYVVYDELGDDPLGLHETLTIKSSLNLISNGSMILMQKVFGNQMVDVRTSNQKLINRAMRIIVKIWDHYKDEFPLSQKELYHLVLHLHRIKTEKEDAGEYCPSVVKLALGALGKDKSLSEIDEVLTHLEKHKESLGWLNSHAA